MRPESFTFLRDLSSSEGLSLVVRGGCMEPLIGSGARIRVRSRRVYRPGDVLVFRTPAGDLAAHRLLGYWRRGGRLVLVTRGDHCVQHDAPVAAELVIGAVDAAVSAGTRLKALLRFVSLLALKLSRSVVR